MSDQPLSIEVSAGELIDKITILEIKSERFTDPAQVENVRRELSVLAAARDTAFGESAELGDLTAELKAVNELLWQIEDDIRACERDQDFGKAFVELARAVYVNNDHRAAFKRRINTLVGSRLIEEKSYTSY